MKVELNKTSFTNDEVALITVECADVEDFSQIQIEIFDVATKNPTSKLGFGNIPIKISENIYQVSFDTKLLPFGMFEIKLVIFHTLKNAACSDNRKIFVSGKDFNRPFFELITSIKLSNSTEVIEKFIFNKEAENEHTFLSGIDIRNNKLDKYIELCVFVFIKKLLIGDKLRFDKFEISTTSNGLDTKDLLNFTNDFLKNQTTTCIEFHYEKNIEQQSHQENPVSVVHFPYIVCSNYEEANDFCRNKVNFLLQALSLVRGGSGEIFDIVLFNRQEPSKTQRFTTTSPYRGNLLTGGMSGENANVIKKYSETLEKNPFKSFLVNLHKEAIAENSSDFKYLRYWQIIEILAESRNYNEKDDLLDFNGKVIYEKENGKIKIDKETNLPVAKKIKGSFNIVYNLMKEIRNLNCYDKTNREELDIKLSDDISIWLAFRNSVAHFGSIKEYTKLKNRKDKKYAKKGIEIMQASNGHDCILFNLKEDVKLILQRELNPP